MLVDPPRTKFDLEADMWLSESQRQKWPVDKMVDFYRDTYLSAPNSDRADTREMAGRLGLPESRVKLLNTIVASGVLLKTALDKGEDALPLMGREKTLRSISRVADILFHDRQPVAVRATGLYRNDDATLEAVRELVVRKAKEYAHES